MTTEEALAFIHSVQWGGSKPGLSRTKELLEKLGNPEKKLKFVHVAGTNGKGSTCAMLASVLRQAGYKTGLYTSPYILRFHERMQVNGQQIPDDTLIRLVERIRPLAESMEDKPTEFEMITALAMVYFWEEQCDIVVLEVGLGGELDSTNVIDAPEAAVICAMGLDHTAILGNTLAEVAGAKAGIVKAGTRAAMYGGVPEADEVIQKRCKELGVPLRSVNFRELTVKETSLFGCSFDYLSYKNLFVPLCGVYQPRNAALAIETVENLRQAGWHISDRALQDGLRQVTWPGRFEVLYRKPIVLLDGAHNPHGMRATVESLKAQLPDREFVFLMGVMKDKDVSGILDILQELPGRYITVRPDNPRAMEAAALTKLLRDRGQTSESRETVSEGAGAAVEYASVENRVICALGSLYFSAEVRSAFTKLLGESYDL